MKQVKLFLGFGNFYRKFISHYSDIAKLLNDITKKDRKIEWTNDTQQSFDNLKKQMTEEPVLIMPDHDRPFQIKLDASKVATGLSLLNYIPMKINIQLLSCHKHLLTQKDNTRYMTENF